MATVRIFKPSGVVTKMNGVDTDTPAAGGGGGSGGTFVTLAPRAVTNADNGKWLSPNGAGTFTLPPVADVDAGFELNFFYPSGTAGTVIVDPDAADHFDYVNNALGIAGQHLSTSTARSLLTIKKSDVANTWVASANGVWTLEAINTQLSVQELDPAAGLDQDMFPPGMHNFTLSLRPGDGAGGALGVAIGSYDGNTGAYTAGAAQADVDPVVMELVDVGGGGFNINPGKNMVVRAADIALWNVAAPPPLSYPFQNPYTVNAGETVTFYLNNDNATPRIYVRSSNAVPTRSFADAVAAGPA